MANFHFELVSPEKMLFSGEVAQVDVPGAEGDFGVLAGHAPIVATLRPGILIIYSDGTPRRMVVLGGFAEMSAKGLTVVADTADTVEDIDKALIVARINEMQERLAKMQPGAELNRLIERLDHFKDVNRHLTATAMH